MALKSSLRSESDSRSSGDAVILTVVGARPQFIKASAVSAAFGRTPGVREIVVNTGQHYDQLMADVFFAELEIPPPDYNLEVGSGTHAVQTARILERLEAVLLSEKPDCVLVYGDTNSTVAGALAAAKLHIPIAHIEAGLRSFNRRMPEEINRVVTDHISDALFAPCSAAAAQLGNEGIDSSQIFEHGDVMYDVALSQQERVQNCRTLLPRLGLSEGQYILCTVHRAENTDEPERLNAIAGGLRLLSREIPVVFPVHPRTRKAFAAQGFDGRLGGGILMIEPLGYFDMALLVSNAAVVATDSGGVQKEAFFHGTPCATLRDETEWTELIDIGWNRLISPISSAAVADGIRKCIGKIGLTGVYPYGNGSAAEKICNTILGRYSRQASYA